MQDSNSVNPYAPEKLTPLAHLACGWPLFMIFIGGAIGGGLGGLAYGVNVSIYKSQLPVAVKFILNILVGLAAFFLWLVIAIAITIYRAKG